MAELMLGQPLFPGESGIDQLVEIIKVLGTPSREQIKTMNPNYMEHKFPQIKPHPFSKVRPLFPGSKTPVERLSQVFRPRTAPESIDLVSKLLEYTPEARLSSVEAMCHPFFDELRQEGAKMPNGKEFPPLFNFTREGTYLCASHDMRTSILNFAFCRAVGTAGPEPAAGAAALRGGAGVAPDSPGHVRADTIGPATDLPGLMSKRA